MIKSFAGRTGLPGLLDALFGDRATRAMRRARIAQRRGIAVAEPLEVKDGALIMRQIKNAKSAGELPRTRENVKALARFLRAIHDARLYPSDFHQGNVLFDEAMKPHLIDYENLRAVLWISKRRRVRNLERLLRDFLNDKTITRTTRMRFLHAYDKQNARELWLRVARRSEQKRAQYAL